MRRLTECPKGSVCASVLLGIAALAQTGCLAKAFVCATNDDCGGGSGAICQTNGYCSFEDPLCPSNQRYDELAGFGLAGTCVVGGVAGESDSANDSTDESTGSSDGAGSVTPSAGSTTNEAEPASSGGTTGPDDSGESSSLDEPVVHEECDGQDNNGNGLIDEWSPLNEDLCGSSYQKCYSREFGGHFYWFCVLENEPWEAARAYCETFASSDGNAQASLAMIESSDESTFIEEGVMEFNDGAADPEIEWWLGGEETQSDPVTMSWIDGTIFYQAGTALGVYTDFLSPPALNDEFCLELIGDTWLGWNDQDCGQHKNFVCEGVP